MTAEENRQWVPELSEADAFSRLDETEDANNNEDDLHRVDARAKRTVSRIIGALCVESEPSILDLAADEESHLPDRLSPSQVVGIGMKQEDLGKNRRLDRYLVQDLNTDPHLPFDDSSFDVVLNTFSIDLLTRPFEVFAEVSRILKPGGLFLVVFSNRIVPEKSVKIWRESDEVTRLLLIEDFFHSLPNFGKTKEFSSRGKPRSQDDELAECGIPSAPIWAVYAEKEGAPVGRMPRPDVPPEPIEGPSLETVEERKKQVRETMRCPYCEERLGRFDVPQSPFSDFTSEQVYICFNDRCPYLITGWDIMAEQGLRDVSFRLMYDPDLNQWRPAPAPVHLRSA